jgi:hypothetical protein
MGLGLDFVRRRFGQRAMCVVLLAAIGELAWTERNLIQTAPRAFLDEVPPLLRPLAESSPVRLYNHLYLPEESQRVLGRDRAFRFEGVPAAWPQSLVDAVCNRSYLGESFAGVFGVPGSYGVDTVRLGSPVIRELSELLLVSSGTPAFVRLLKVGAVSHVIALHAVPGLEPVAEARAFFPEPIRLQRVPGALPRVYAVGGARKTSPVEAPHVLLDQAFDATQSVLLEGDERAVPSGFGGRVDVRDRRADHWRIEVDLSHPGWVVIVDAWSPGWRARVDGIDAPVLKANAAFRAVAVPAGFHVVTLTYRPTSVVVGLMLTALGLVLTAALWLANRHAGSVPA